MTDASEAIVREVLNEDGNAPGCLGGNRRAVYRYLYGGVTLVAEVIDGDGDESVGIAPGREFDWWCERYGGPAAWWQPVSGEDMGALTEEQRVRLEEIVREHLVSDGEPFGEAG